MALPSFLTSGLVAGAAEGIAVVKTALDEIKTILTNGVGVEHVRDGSFLVTEGAVADVGSRHGVATVAGATAMGFTGETSIAHGGSTAPPWVLACGAMIDTGGTVAAGIQVTVIAVSPTHVLIRWAVYGGDVDQVQVVWEARW